MTMPDQRYRAVLRTEELLKKIFNGKYLVDGDYEKAYDEIWLEVKKCIRHYPSKLYMDDAQELAPQVFGEIDENKT